jgi:outer membrane protein OmpA-like peptidoglycan-associated protein
MKLKSLLVLLLAGIWGVGSWWWYTCKIKGFCGADVKTTQVAGAAATGAATLAAGAGTSLNSTTGDDATKDSDNDGIPDAKEIELGLNPNNEDTDGDGISDAIEVAQQPQDTDGDGKINAFDNDDDGDGVLTADENPDPNSDGNVDDAADANGNKIADYLEKGVATPATVQTAGAGSAGAVTGLNNATGADKAAADKAAAEQKAEADKAAAAQKAEADKLAADQAAAAQKAEADKLAADQAAATQKAEADKLAAEQKAKEESDKVTIETTTAQNGDIGPATLHFPTGSANPQLAGETKAYFEKVAQFLKDNATAKVTIVGHTDNKGDPAKNKALGLKRAEMLQKMLLDSGAPKDRVNAASEGPNKPIADNATEEGRKKNRRVEITPVK